MGARGKCTGAMGALALACTTCMGCAANAPLLYGGRTAPAKRAELTAGAGTRHQVSGYDAGAEVISGIDAASVAGSAPVAALRYGLSDTMDAGVMMTPWSIRLDGRLSYVIRRSRIAQVALMTGISPSYSSLSAIEFSSVSLGGSRYGLDVPLLLGIDVDGLIEAWAGARVGAERLDGHIRASEEADADIAAWGLRAGPVVGLGAGFRRLHCLVEASLLYERWDGRQGAEEAVLSGVAVQTAFAIRYRY